MTNQHIKELDGIRGIAILLVMSFHTFQRASYFTQNKILIFLAALSRVGWAGVDIFFVLSGFLITSILLAEKDENNYFKFFYARRALRIFPLYYLFIIVMVLGMPLIAADYVQSIYHDIPILALYLQNWIWVGLFHAELPLHLSATWSLAVEEQF